MVCSKVGLLITWDDNDSLRNEENVGVIHFDGALVGTKKDGVQELVGYHHIIALTELGIAQSRLVALFFFPLLLYLGW